MRRWVSILFVYWIGGHSCHLVPSSDHEQPHRDARAELCIAAGEMEMEWKGVGRLIRFLVAK